MCVKVRKKNKRSDSYSCHVENILKGAVVYLIKLDLNCSQERDE